jgi:hypothetical protein
VPRATTGIPRPFTRAASLEGKLAAQLDARASLEARADGGVSGRASSVTPSITGLGITSMRIHRRSPPSAPRKIARQGGTAMFLRPREPCRAGRASHLPTAPRLTPTGGFHSSEGAVRRSETSDSQDKQRPSARIFCWTIRQRRRILSTHSSPVTATLLPSQRYGSKTFNRLPRAAPGAGSLPCSSSIT